MPHKQPRPENEKEAFSVRPVILLLILCFLAFPLAWTLSAGQVSYSAMALYVCLLGIIASGVSVLKMKLSARKSHHTLLSAHEAAHGLLENRLMAIESSQEGVAIINPLSELTYMNQALFEIYGIPQEAEDQFLGENWLRLFPAAHTKFMADKAMIALERDGFWAGQIELNFEGGSRQILDIALSRLPDGGMICTTRDMTERHKNEKEMKKLEEQFFQAQKMEAIGRLAGGIAHDFNNILAAIGGYAEFLEEDLKEGSQQQTFAKNILAAGREAKALVDQMLAFSRRKESAMEPVDMVISLQETVSILKASVPKTIEVVTDYKVPQAVISANSTQVMQVFMNLCVNARDAMENDKGEIRLEVNVRNADNFPQQEAVIKELPSPKEQPPTWIDDLDASTTRLVLGQIAKDRPYVVLRLSDTGCGMSRLVMEHIFEPFFTTKPVNKGTGLGMATVHGVVTGHQGAMVIESTIGKGTVFELYFPSVDAELPVTQKKVERKKGNIQPTETRILLVEDQDSVRDMMFNMLVRMGYQVESCSSGLEALDILREHPDEFDLVITDENMPRMSGTELVYQVHFDFPDIPFIMLTGYTRQQLEAMAKEHPAIKAIVRKPVSREILEEQIKAVLKNMQGKQESESVVAE